MDELTRRSVESIRSRVTDARAQVKYVLEFAQPEKPTEHLLDAIASLNDALQICEGLKSTQQERPRNVESILLPLFQKAEKQPYGWTVDSTFVFDAVPGNPLPWIRVSVRWEGKDHKPSGEITTYLIDLLGREIFEQLAEDAEGVKSMKSLKTF
jgi:hypothetical protein